MTKNIPLLFFFEVEFHLNIGENKYIIIDNQFRFNCSFLIEKSNDRIFLSSPIAFVEYRNNIFSVRSYIVTLVTL
jgi:hypothetical protein